MMLSVANFFVALLSIQLLASESFSFSNQHGILVLRKTLIVCYSTLFFSVVLASKFSRQSSLTMHFEEAITGNTALATGALPAQRYVATNRFKVRPSSGVSD